MTNVIEMMTSLYPVSDDTIQLLKDNVTLCHFPKKYQLIKANQYSTIAKSKNSRPKNKMCH